MPPSLSRRDVADRILSGSAGVVALSALAVSVYQAKIAREQQKMSAWPYVTQGNAGSDSVYARLVQNVGLGPALVRSVRVTVDGRPARTWRGVMLAALAADSAHLRALTAGSHLTTSSVLPGMVLVAGSTTELLHLEGTFAPTLRRVLNDPRVRVRVCYCSVYGDCWLSDSEERVPAPLRACPDDGAAEFQS